MTYLEKWLPTAHPDRPDLVEQAQALAASLGSQLGLPRLSWKYAWIRALFGWHAAKTAQLGYNGLKFSAQRVCDRAWYNAENLSGQMRTRRRVSG